ncbi:MAG TPA: hypothetical protein VGH99_15800 [Pseudonocardia sp.]
MSTLPENRTPGRAVATPRGRRLFVTACLATSAVFLAILIAMVTHLVRVGELDGGLHGGRWFPWDGPTWLHLLVNHVTVGYTSRSGDTLAPLALGVLAVGLAARRRSWEPLVRTAIGFGLVFVLLAIGKVIVGDSSTMSGPATAAVVVAGLALWLLWPELTRSGWLALATLAVSYLLCVGGTQLYTGHRLGEVLLSWLAGGVAALLVTRVALPGGRAGAHRAAGRSRFAPADRTR